MVSHCTSVKKSMAALVDTQNSVNFISDHGDVKRLNLEQAISIISCLKRRSLSSFRGRVVNIILYSSIFPNLTYIG